MAWPGGCSLNLCHLTERMRERRTKGQICRRKGEARRKGGGREHGRKMKNLWPTVLAQSPGYCVIRKTKLCDSAGMRIFLPRPGPLLTKGWAQPLKTNEGVNDGSPLRSWVRWHLPPRGEKEHLFSLFCIQWGVNFAQIFPLVKPLVLLPVLYWCYLCVGGAVTGENALKANYLDKFWVWLLHLPGAH